MPAKIWYNGSMHDMTNLQMVTFIGGVKKRITKGITFINGEKKILWQTGNYALNSWQVSELNYPNAVDTPTGLFANKNKVIYTVGEYVARDDVSNISNPVIENTVKNGEAFSWGGQSGSTQTFYSGTYFMAGGPVGSNISGSQFVILNKLNIGTTDASVVVGSGSYTATTSDITNATHSFSETYGWISVASAAGAYRVYKNGDTLVASVPTNGYGDTTVPARAKMATQSDQYIVFSYPYKATSSSTTTYGIKRVNLASGVLSDIVTGLTSEITSIMVDGQRIVYTSGNKMYERSSAGATLYHTYTSTHTQVTLIGRIGNYYYLGSTLAGSGQTRYMNIEIVEKSSFTLREEHETGIKAMTYKTIPYISSNKYLCFGSWHGISSTYTTLVGGGSGSAGRPVTVTTWSEVEHRLNRIQGY